MKVEEGKSWYILILGHEMVPNWINKRVVVCCGDLKTSCTLVETLSLHLRLNFCTIWLLLIFPHLATGFEGFILLEKELMSVKDVIG